MQIQEKFSQDWNAYFYGNAYTLSMLKIMKRDVKEMSQAKNHLLF